MTQPNQSFASMFSDIFNAVDSSKLVKQPTETEQQIIKLINDKFLKILANDTSYYPPEVIATINALLAIRKELS